MDTLQNAHFFQLSSQGNIYTLTSLELINGVNKILVASLKREIIFFECIQDPAGTLVPTAKEISFTYLPSGAEIISMTAFNKSDTTNDFVVGITIIKNSSDLHALETYLNIYAGWEPSLEFNMESISQNCLNNIELKFIPYHLTYTYLITWVDNQMHKEVVFLLSGSDNKIHIYQENKISHGYKEMEHNEYFPEFFKPPSVVVWIQVYFYDEYKERITAFGCECGYVRLCRINIKNHAIIFNLSTNFDNTISSVCIYPDQNDVKCPQIIKEKYKSETRKTTPILNLVVTNTILPAVFFHDILKYGLKKYGTLPRYETTNTLSTARNADIDFDGYDEILVGSNEEIIAYKFDTNNRCWYISDIKRFPTSVLHIRYMDITGDGVKELIVLTIKGVHILQHDPESVQEALEEKLKSFTIPEIDVIAVQK